LAYHASAAPRPAWTFLLSGRLAVKTYVANAQNRERNWLVVDASGQTLGRWPRRSRPRCAASASPSTRPHVDTGDFVVVVNARRSR
jgi:large subunit ribosomal protein L13